MTNKQQQAQLKNAIVTYIKAQKAANDALALITEISLLENEGNPLNGRLMGIDSIASYAGLTAEQNDEFNKVNEDAERIRNFSGHAF